MKKLLLIVALALLPGVAVAQSFCAAVVLCDEFGHYYEGVDPDSECAKHQHQFCTERRLVAARNESIQQRLMHYTKRYAACKKQEARLGKGSAAKAAARSVKKDRCEVFARRAKKYSLRRG